MQSLAPTAEPDETITPPPLGVPNAVVHEAIRAYNDAARAVGWTRATRLTEARRQKLRRRILDAGGIDGWRAAVERAARSRFCRGETSNWRASLDFLLQESSFTKLLEGVYDDRDGAPSRSRLSAMAEAASEIAHLPPKVRRRS